MCQTPLGYPVEYAINEDITYDSSVTAKFKVSAPTPIELIMAGMALSAKDRATQASNKYIPNFPSWPLTTPEEIKVVQNQKIKNKNIKFRSGQVRSGLLLGQSLGP